MTDLIDRCLRKFPASSVEVIKRHHRKRHPLYIPARAITKMDWPSSHTNPSQSLVFKEVQFFYTTYGYLDLLGCEFCIYPTLDSVSQLPIDGRAFRNLRQIMLDELGEIKQKPSHQDILVTSTGRRFICIDPAQQLGPGTLEAFKLEYLYPTIALHGRSDVSAFTLTALSPYVATL
jgi:hypothetical protein